MKILTNYDFSQNQILNVVVQKLAVPPANPVSGQIYYNTANNRLYYFDGTKWVGSDALDAVMSGTDIVRAINESDSTISDARLSQAVNSAIAMAHNTHEITDINGLIEVLTEKANKDTVDGIEQMFEQVIGEGYFDNHEGTTLTDVIERLSNLATELNNKVDNSRVLTDVPANAKFTDTITTINGKTGEITKEDIVALGIPAQDTKYTLPVAGTNLGGVKAGGDVTIDSSGVISVKDNSHNHVIENITGLQAVLDSKETPAGATAKASTAENNAKSYTDAKIAELVGSAPETLDTLHELAQALGSDPNFATTITNILAQKTNKFTQAIGDGAKTSFVLTHNLNTRDVVVMIRETASPYAQVITDVEMTTVNTITVKFAQPPATNEYTVTIIG